MRIISTFKYFVSEGECYALLDWVDCNEFITVCLVKEE